MTNQNQSGSKATRRPYQAPRTVFVPLKLEERMLSCSKVMNQGGPCNNPNLTQFS